MSVLKRSWTSLLPERLQLIQIVSFVVDNIGKLIKYCLGPHHPSQLVITNLSIGPTLKATKVEVYGYYGELNPKDYKIGLTIWSSSNAMAFSDTTK